MSKFPQKKLRRILNKLKQEENFILVSDGQALCYSNQRLFTKENSTSANPGNVDSEGLSVPGKYGPADVGGHHVPLTSNDIYNDYHVRVKESVDENDEDADRVKNSWHRVRLKEVACIPFKTVQDMFRGLQVEQETLHRVKQAVEILMKNAHFSLMNSFGKTPRRFYFAEETQKKIMDEFRNYGQNTHKIINDFRSKNNLMPNIGLQSSLKVCSKGNFFTNVDICLDYVRRENLPLLVPEQSSIVGIRLNSLYEPVPVNLRGKVEEVMKKLTFHVTYVRQKNTETWLARKRELGWNEKRIAQANKNVRKYCRMKEDRDKNNKGIIWQADDLNEHSFEVVPKHSDGESKTAAIKHTIFSYFKEKYGITLKYPKMPCIFIGKNEWFPMEFLTQALDKASNENHNDSKLKFYDAVAGTERNKSIERLSAKFAHLLEQNPECDLLRYFGIKREKEPVVLKAKVLPEPKLSFKEGIVPLKDGSWNLRNAKFHNPADLPSFAFLNLGNPSSGHDYMRGLFRSMEQHGITLPYNVDVTRALDSITHNCQLRPIDVEKVFEAFSKSIEQSQMFFLYDKYKAFQRNNVWFRTRILLEGRWQNCLIIPPPDGITGQVGYMLEGNEHTHIVDDNIYVRQTVLVRLNGEEKYVDPFEFRFHFNGNYHECFAYNTWKRCDIVRLTFRNPDNQEYMGPKQNIIPSHILNVTPQNIESVGMMFVYLPTDDTQTYHLVKMMSQFEFGIPSQACVQAKYEKQKSKHQFLSNIALKVNTKLMSSTNMARAWTTSTDSFGRTREGIPWVNETPTLVIGIHLSHSLGQDGITVVGASVGLDEYLMQFGQCYRVQSKSDVVQKDIMINLIKTLFFHFLVHGENFPERVLIYRSGGSEGEFEKIRTNEISKVRLALHQVLKQMKRDFVCPEACESGCHFCTPPITFVICQMQHSICVVPTPQAETDRFSNVLSGTCVDDQNIMDFRDGQLLATKNISRKTHVGSKIQIFEDVEHLGYDFILTSHAGLKGTSKPVYYRVVLNENAVWKANDYCTPLTKDMLQICTYHQSFQYGTATKAVRAVPVIYYSQRICNNVMGYINYLRPRKRVGLARYENMGYPLEEVKAKSLVPENDESKKLDDETMESKHYILKEMNREDRQSLPLCIRQELQMSFSPYDPNQNYVIYGHPLRPPLRPHMTA